jgi:hypothetical protein
MYLYEERSQIVVEHFTREVIEKVMPLELGFLT